MSNCPFCYENIKHRVIAEHGSAVAIEDLNPVTEGHLLILPKRHVKDYFLMDAVEKRDAQELVAKLKDRITADDPTVSGFNLGTNAGTSAGQTVFHAHIHLIPRRDGDTDHPRGGVRGVMPGKRSY